MDDKLGGWARAVKSRRRGRLPPLWLFTDFATMPDVVATIRNLPGGGLCGVVFRHDGLVERAELAHQVWLVCRSRRIPLVVAGRLQVGNAGRHLRGGRGPKAKGLCTTSAHGVADLVRAARVNADAAFLSPVFETSSHPGQPALGVVRWAALARRSRIPVFALGGVDGGSVRALPRHVSGAGAVTALR